MSHRAPDPLTVFPDQVMLENDASWLVFSVFSDDVRSPSAPTTPCDPFLLFFALLNKWFTFNQLCQLVFVISSHPILFQPTTESLGLAPTWTPRTLPASPRALLVAKSQPPACPINPARVTLVSHLSGGHGEPLPSWRSSLLETASI
jgi:hypothetical protein